MIGGAPSPNGSFDEVLLQGRFELNYDVHSQQCLGCERSSGWCGYGHNQTNGGTGFTCFCDGGPTADHCGTGTYASSRGLIFPCINFLSRFPALLEFKRCGM
jgi:hypothetical protein